MAGISKKSPRFISSLYQNSSWTNRSFVSIAFILLIGTGCKTRVDGSFMHEARAVVEDFYGRYNATTAVDLVFVLDRSETVTKSGWYSIIKFVRNILDRFIVDQDHIRVAIVTFSSSAVAEFNDLEDDATANGPTRCSVYHRLYNLIGTVRGGNAATHAALSEARKILLNAREIAKKAVLLITNSFSNIGEPPKKMSLQIQSLNWNWSSTGFGPQVEVYAFGIAGAYAEFLESIASDLPNHFSHFPSFRAFEQFTDSLQRSNNIEDQWIDAEMSNCDQDQECGHLNSKCMCGTTTGWFSCACKPGYQFDGSVCKACQQGYYKPGYVPGRCRPCPQNSTTSVDGATNSSSCHPLPGHQKCPDLPTIENGYNFFVSGNKLEEIENTGRDCKDVRDGNSCYYDCKTGYRLISGSKSMRCNAWGKWEGRIPHCQIVDCEVISESWANASNVTLTYANGSTTYGSMVFASCESGLVAFGPTVWTCGENAIWKGKSNFLCKEVHCGALIPVKYANMVPADCATVKKPLGYECQTICDKGFNQTGPGNFTCSFKSRTFWKPHMGEEDQSECHDIEDPEITCPPDIAIESWNWDNCFVVDYHKDKPTYDDNSRSARFRILNEPENGTFCQGLTVLTYEAYDQAGRKKSCDRKIHIGAKQFETIQCPNDIVMTVNSSRRSLWVSWPDPIFHARSGDVLPFRCTETNGVYLAVGNRSVVCYPEAYPSSPCRFMINIIDPLCDLPFPDRKPFRGNVSCEDSPLAAKRCSIRCQDGYELIADPPQNFICRWDGTWNLKTIWPQCHRSRRPNHAKSVNRLVVTFNGSVSVCEQKKGNIYDSFIQKAKHLLQYKPDDSKPLCKFSFQSVDLNCTEVNAPLDNLMSATDSVDSTMNTEISAGNFSLTFVIKAELNVTVTSVVTKSQQIYIADALESINDNIHASTENGEFVWNASDLLVTAISLDPADIEFPNFNCTDDEVRQVERNAAACFSCSFGTFYHDGSCVPCPLGSYKDFEGGKPCKPCKGDQNTTILGARNASECHDPCSAGHSSLTGYEPCTPCRVGEYQSERKSNSCLSCPVNQTTSSVESTSVDDCYEPVNCSIFNSTCEPHGICVRRRGYDIQCLCQAGFTGLECETNIDDCEHSLCQNNGTCTDQIAAYECHCSSSFTGERCEIEVDECTSFPCKNGGSCIDDSILYNCVCPQGFSGTNCEINIDECNSSPCKNGTCKDGIQGFECACVDGYTGHICDRLIDYCVNMSCSNGGTCIGSRTALTCSCLKGYTGTNCESEFDSCASNPCQNNGTCTNSFGSYHCWCPSGFIGDTCTQGESPDFDLVFPQASTTSFVELRLKLSASSFLQQISVCTWMRSSDTHNTGTIWSYAAENNWLRADTANVLTASDYGNLNIFVNGKMAATNLVLNDGTWHHLCFTWDGVEGDWTLYLNGTRRQSGHNLAKGTHIETNGILILGQKQDSFGGSFSSHESFVGELTRFSIFDEALSGAVIAAMASVESGKCGLTHQGNVISWTDVLHNAIHGNVTIQNASWCMDVNECRSIHLNNCTNGTRCEDTLGSFVCVKCETLDCFKQEVSTECTTDRCLNGAICKINAGGYYCECKPSFSGRHCNEKVPMLECESNPCRNGGTCNSSASDCFCVKPWTGRYCQVSSQVTCEAQPCFNNGTCLVDGGQGYRCECPQLNLTLGGDCEILSVCASSPCQSEGTCVVTESVTGYKCECQSGYSGENCEIATLDNYCKNAKCENGGTCQSHGIGFDCKCTVGYEGIYCQDRLKTAVKVYNVRVKLEEPFSSTLPSNETFKKILTQQIHKTYQVNNAQIVINIKNIRAGSVLIDFDLTHTYYLDQQHAGPVAMKKILEDQLMTGKLGPYKATLEDFVFTEAAEPQSSNAALYIPVIVITIIVTVLTFALVYICIRRNKARAKNKPLSPLRVSNPMYQGDFSLSNQNRNVQDSVYCDPVELLPYSTSEDSDKDSVSCGDDQTKKKKKNWLFRQQIPLPPKPDEAHASGACGLSVSELNRASPPPPYSADALAPIPPPREISKHQMPSVNQHSYANQAQAAAADTCYFMPLSDEEAELLTAPKSDESISENPAFDPESAYLIPRQQIATRDVTEDTYLAPRIDDEAEDIGGAVAATNGTELGNGSDVTYAIRSISWDSSEGNNGTSLLPN